jgi:glycerol-3-phosphate dehydrogenase subunit B
MKKNVLAQGIVLASGRFMGKGLVADRKKVREPIFDIPVVQPETREGWYRNLFFDKRGHDINKAGLVTDSFQRPIGQDGVVLYDRLFVAGSILAHQDWTREKCGSGIALATGFNAVCSFIDLNESVFFDVNCLSA